MYRVGLSINEFIIFLNKKSISWRIGSPSGSSHNVLKTRHILLLLKEKKKNWSMNNDTWANVRKIEELGWRF